MHKIHSENLPTAKVTPKGLIQKAYFNLEMDKTKTPTKDIQVIHQEVQEKFQGKIFRTVFRYWTLRNFSKQYNMNCKNFYQLFQENQHKFGALMYCPQDLPIHVSGFLNSLSKWINKTHFNGPILPSFRRKNSALPDSMIGKETLMIFQVTRRGINDKSLLLKFEKTKRKFEKFVQKNQQQKIRKVIIFFVSSQNVPCDDKDVSFSSSDFVGGVPCEFGGILHLPPQIYFEDQTGLDQLVAIFFNNISHIEQETNNSRLLLQQDGQFQADLLRRERENIEKEKEQINREKEEINREKEEVKRQREQIHKEREEQDRKRREAIPINQPTDPLTNVTNRFSGLHQFPQHSQCNISPRTPQSLPHVQARRRENTSYDHSPSLESAAYISRCRRLIGLPTVPFENFQDPSSAYLTIANTTLLNSEFPPLLASRLPNENLHTEYV